MTLSTQGGKVTTRHRKSFHVNQSQLKFRPSGSSESHGKGTRPLPEPMAVHDFIQMIVIHGCKKVLLLDHRYKIGAYLALTFVLSILADAFNFPKTYFSNPRNGLNVLFTGYGWLWTLVVAGVFITMTSLVYNCGDRRKVAMYHLSRLMVGTAMWWCWTTAFAAIEHRTGACSSNGHGSKKTCRQGGGVWRAFDISGHTFLLIYCNLLLMEEAKLILGWDGIKDAIRKEEFNRSEGQSSATELTPEHETYLKDLTSAQFSELQHYYGKLAFFVRLNFFTMTILSLIYDLLFLATMLYFHVMTEKLLAAFFAIFAWFITYRIWFAMAPFPVLPGACSAFRRDVAVKAAKARGGLPRRRPTLSGDDHQQFQASSFVELRRKEMMLVETTTVIEP